MHYELLWTRWTFKIINVLIYIFVVPFAKLTSTYYQKNIELSLPYNACYGFHKKGPLFSTKDLKAMNNNKKK